MPALEYNLSVIGMRDIDRAFMGLERRIADHVRKVEAITAVRGSGTGVGSRFSAANNNARMLTTERLALKVAADQERASRRAATQAERAERHKTMVAEREAAKRVRIAEKEARDKARTEERLNRASERATIQNNHRAATRRMGFARAVGGNIVGIGRSGLALTGLGGGAMFANAVHDYAKTGEMATQLAGKMAGSGATAEQIASIRGNVITGSMGVKGLSLQQVLGMIGSYGGITGDYAGGMGVAPELGKLALATGAVPEELASVAGNVSMKLAGTMKGEELQKAVLATTRMIAGQGEMGSVEVEDLARYGGRITASAGVYSGTREENMAKLGAMAQIARGSGSASGAEEATTAVARMYNDLNSKRKDIKELGVTVDDAKTGKMRSADQIIIDLLEKTGGNWQKISPIFGQMSEKAALGMHQIYSGAEEKQKGSGRAAVEAEMNKFAGATLAEKDVNTRATAMAGEQTFLLAENMKLLNEQVGSKLVPVVSTFIGKLGEASPKLGNVAGSVGSAAAWFVENPFKGVGALIAAAIGKEVVAAGLSKVVAVALGASATALVASAIASVVGTYSVLSATDNSTDTTTRLNALNADTINQVNKIDRMNVSPERKYELKKYLLEGAERETGDILSERTFAATLGGSAQTDQAEAMQSDYKQMLTDAFHAMLDQKEAARELKEAAAKLSAAGIGGGNTATSPNTGGIPGWMGPVER
jgi:hypothetical protein